MEKGKIIMDGGSDEVVDAYRDKHGARERAQTTTAQGESEVAERVKAEPNVR